VGNKFNLAELALKKKFAVHLDYIFPFFTFSWLNGACVFQLALDNISAFLQHLSSKLSIKESRHICKDVYYVKYVPAGRRASERWGPVQVPDRHQEIVQSATC